MAINDFLPFATDPSAHVESQAAYSGDTDRPLGQGPAATANEELYNKALRQATSIAAMVAQFIVDNAGVDATDDGNIATLEANFADALIALVTGNFPTVASVADVQTATLVTKALTPGRMVYSPFTLKAWAVCAEDGTLVDALNISGCTHTLGNYTFQLSGGLDLEPGLYLANSLDPTAGPRICAAHGQTTGINTTAHVSVADAAGNPADGITTIAVFGATDN